MLNKVSKVTNERFIISLFLFSHVMSKVLQTLPDVPIIVKLISSGLLIFPLEYHSSKGVFVNLTGIGTDEWLWG